MFENYHNYLYKKLRLRRVFWGQREITHSAVQFSWIPNWNKQQLTLHLLSLSLLWLLLSLPLSLLQFNPNGTCLLLHVKVTGFQSSWMLILHNLFKILTRSYRMSSLRGWQAYEQEFSRQQASILSPILRQPVMEGHSFCLNGLQGFVKS